MARLMDFDDDEVPLELDEKILKNFWTSGRCPLMIDVNFEA
jgi:hypothetical protein